MLNIICSVRNSELVCLGHIVSDEIRATPKGFSAKAYILTVFTQDTADLEWSACEKIKAIYTADTGSKMKCEGTKLCPHRHIYEFVLDISPKASKITFGIFGVKSSTENPTIDNIVHTNWFDIQLVQDNEILPITVDDRRFALDAE